MSEIEKIVFTSAATVLGGTLVYSLSRIIETFVLNPISKINELKADISHNMILHANKFGNRKYFDKKEFEGATLKLRMLASELRAKKSLLSCYSAWAILRVVPKKKDLYEASDCLIGLSNSMDDADKLDSRRKRLKNLLKIDF